MTDALTFLVDVDGTLCWQVPRACEYARDEYGLSLSADEVVQWDFPLPDPALDMHIGDLIDELLTDRPEWFLSPLPVLDGAGAALSRIRAAGHRVHIATHRHPRTHDITRAWLDANDLPYDEFVERVPRNKGRLDGHILVDDYHGNVANALAEGKAGVLMRQPYSDPAACADAHVAESWPDVLSAFDL